MTTAMQLIQPPERLNPRYFGQSGPTEELLNDSRRVERTFGSMEDIQLPVRGLFVVGSQAYWSRNPPFMLKHSHNLRVQDPEL